MKKVGILGASGYTGYELVKLLVNHPKVELAVLNSQSYAGKKVKELYHDFDSELEFTNYSIEEVNKIGIELLFLCMPNGEAMKIIPKLKKGIKVIDLSADYRFSDISKFESVYGIKHTDKETKAIYGLPELFRKDIKSAKLVANPGCYVSACLLAALPIQNISSYVVFDCKSGWSGAGKESIYAKDPNTIKDNLVAYNLTKHRHKYETEQFLKVKLSFSPHVIETFRGIMCTAHVMLKEKVTPEMIKSMYKDYYHNEPFVEIADKTPELREVQNNNLCKIGGFEIDENNQLVVVSVIDNLLKGASGQAVQNMNVMLGFDEKEGLE